MKALNIRMTADRFGAPLAEVEGLPGDGVALRPDDLRRLAAALLRAADDAAARKTTHRGRQLPAERRIYPLIA